MTLKFCSISSGSSGNCYLIKTNTTAILVDAGISARKIIDGIEASGLDYQDIQALLVTHEHIDHIKSVRTLVKKIKGLKVCSNRATFDRFCETSIAEAHFPFETGESFMIGDITVKTFNISHDAAEPVGFSFQAHGRCISLVTDTGLVTDEIYQNVKNSDLLVVEANHDIHTLQFCSYPYQTKRRILGEKGHLSNEAAGELIRDILIERKRQREVVADSDSLAERQSEQVSKAQMNSEDTSELLTDKIKDEIENKIENVPIVLLAHLSRENNFPEMAIATIKNILEAENLFEEKDLELEVLQRDTLSKMYCL